MYHLPCKKTAARYIDRRERKRDIYELFIIFVSSPVLFFYVIDSPSLSLFPPRKSYQLDYKMEVRHRRRNPILILWSKVLIWKASPATGSWLPIAQFVRPLSNSYQFEHHWWYRNSVITSVHTNNSLEKDEAMTILVGEPHSPCHGVINLPCYYFIDKRFPIVNSVVVIRQHRW